MCVWVIGRAMVVWGGEVLLKLSTFLQLKSKLRNRPKNSFSTAVIFLEKKTVRNFFIGKISDFSNSEHSRRCLQNSSVGTRNSQEKILSSFRDIFEKDVFFDIESGFRVPSTTHAIKKYEVSKKPISRGNLKVKKLSSREI